MRVCSLRECALFHHQLQRLGAPQVCQCTFRNTRAFAPVQDTVREENGLAGLT